MAPSTSPPSGFSPSPVSSSTSKCSCFSKSLVVLLILVAIPLFPSQAPDFISDTILTEFWEIFHLLFIGIAVSYGLFGRKTANAKTVSSRNYAVSDDIASFSSIFEGGFGNSEDNIDGGDSGNQCLLDRDGERVVGESKKNRSSVSKSLVVVSNGKCVLDGSSDFRPLNLPVRSLRSSVENDRLVGMRNGNRGEDSKWFEGKGVADDAKVVRIRGMVPKNLEKKFEEVAEASVIPWRSRSVKMEKRGEGGSFGQTGHCRPQSVGEIELEGLGSRQTGHCRPQSVGEIELESIGSRQAGHCRPQSVGEIELESLGSRSFQDSQGVESLKVENGRTEWDFWKPVDSVSQQEQGLMNVKTSLNGARARVYSVGSATEMNRVNDLECNLKDSGDLGDESGIEKGKRGVELLGSDVKSPRLARALSRAKSVRTIKPNNYTGDKKDASSNQADYSVKKEEQTELEDSHANHRNQEADRVFPMPKPKPILHDEEKDDIDHKSFTDSEEETRSEFDKSSFEEEDDVESYLASDAELGSEVDRKAGEFIAKFKEQIRLQKSSSSVKGYNGW